MCSELSSCPRCGGGLIRRLADLECPGCGWYKPATGTAGRRPRSAEDGSNLTGGASSGARLQSAVDAHPGSQGGSYRGLLHSYEVAPPDAFSLTKLWFLIAAGLLLTGGNLALLWTVPAVFPDGSLIGATLIASLLTVGIAALALYVDWAAAKLIAGVLALGFIALDLLQCAHLWSGYVAIARIKHVVDMLILLSFAVLMFYEWRRENTPVDA